jgi:4-amino-4-deoxy-L-arabinose transferase-like glycosyltransferase
MSAREFMETSERQSQQILEDHSFYGAILLTVLACLLFLPGLGARDFWAPGEPIYGEVIRVMFEKSNWLVPTLNGQIYADKPVLYFWFALLVSKLAGGVNEWTVRVPAAIGGLGLVLTTYQFGKTFYDRQTGFLAAIMLATSSRLFWESRFLRLDTLLAFFLLLGFFFSMKALLGKGGGAFFLLGYACFALATLTKGPIGIALPGLAILSFIAISSRWRELREMRLVSGAFLVIVLIAPWLLALHFRNEDQWLHDFIWIHNVQNYALEPIGHIRPFYYYFLNLPPDFLPWTVLLPGAVIFYYPWMDRLKNPVSLGLTCWFVAIFVFFSFSKSKIAYYLLPLLPAEALFAANYLNELISGKTLRGAHWRCTAPLLYILAAILFFSGFATPFITYKIERGLFPWAAPLAAILLVGSAVMLVSLKRKKLALFFWSFVALFVGVSLVMSVAVLPYFDQHKSPRAVGEFVRNHVPDSIPVYIFQSTMSDFNYYAGRASIPVISSEEEIAKLSASHAQAYLLINDKDLKEVKRLKDNREVVIERRVGDRKWYLLRLPQVAS